MVTDFLNWSVALFTTLVDWLGSLQIVEGVSLLAFFVGVFVIGLLLRALLVH